MLRKRTKLLWLTFILCLLSIGVMVFALMQGPRTEVRFTPPPFDPQAVTGQPDLTSADGYGTIDATVYTFSVCGEIQLDGDQIHVWFTNHPENQSWLKLAIKDENDLKIGESGLIRPGEYVKSITLSSPPHEAIPVKMVVMGYEPETYYSVGNVTLQTNITLP